MKKKKKNIVIYLHYQIIQYPKIYNYVEKKYVILNYKMGLILKQLSRNEHCRIDTVSQFQFYA